jgi:hypothetical protein
MYNIYTSLDTCDEECAECDGAETVEPVLDCDAVALALLLANPRMIGVDAKFSATNVRKCVNELPNAFENTGVIAIMPGTSISKWPDDPIKKRMVTSRRRLCMLRTLRSFAKKTSTLMAT